MEILAAFFFATLKCTTQHINKFEILQMTQMPFPSS